MQLLALIVHIARMHKFRSTISLQLLDMVGLTNIKLPDPLTSTLQNPLKQTV